MALVNPARSPSLPVPKVKLGGGPDERREAAEVARGDLQPAANDLRREEAGITRVEIRCGELERIEGDVATQRSRAAQRELRLAADSPGERGVGERKATHRRLALERDPRRFVGQRAADTALVRSDSRRKGGPRGRNRDTLEPQLSCHLQIDRPSSTGCRT